MPHQNPKFSPISRFTLDTFWRNGNSAVIAELKKLRRVTSILVAEMLQVQNNLALADGKQSSLSTLLEFDLTESKHHRVRTSVSFRKANRRRKQLF
ncbi:hypothetical protein SLE2022_238820 [Rubroshorea leprosula]